MTVNYIFNISLKTAYEDLQTRFYKQVIEFFHPEDLKDVIIRNIDYDLETFEKNAHYRQGYDNFHHSDVLESFTQTDFGRKEEIPCIFL